MIIAQMEKPSFRFFARILCIVTLLMALFTVSTLLPGKDVYAASIHGWRGVIAPRASGVSGVTSPLGALTAPPSAVNTPVTPSVVNTPVPSSVVTTPALSPATTTPVSSSASNPPVSSSAATTPGVQVISGGRTDLPRVALTFDDGPDPTYTPQILQVLAANNAHATFFEIGQRVQSNPGVARQVVADGDVIGNHTWDHPSLTTITPAAQASELMQASTAIENVTGMTPTLFRPPYGAINAQVESVAAEQQMATVMWSVDTADWQLPGVQRIVTAALNGAHNGSIILMHDGGGNRSQTVAALSLIIKGLQARGYELVTVPELVSGTM